VALMPVAEALSRVLADAEPLAAEPTPLTEAHGRVLAADVAALRTQPPADVSAMDGYAARSADVARTPVKLKLVGEVAAGHPFQGAVGAGEAARIFTGGVLPPGTDTIVIQEKTRRAMATPSLSPPLRAKASTSASRASTSSAARCCSPKVIVLPTAISRLRPP